MSNITQDEKESKYGDDEKYESYADVKLFFPIATEMIDPLYCMGFSPNAITGFSTLFTLLSIYFLHLDKRIYACSAYLFGYILDCVDGRMARKYSLGSNLGMTLDFVSDNISNLALIGYIMLNRPMNNKIIIILIILGILTILISISYGINEAVSSYNKTGSDNFYEAKIKQLGNLEQYSCYEQIIYQIYLQLTNVSYQAYRKVFPTYDIKTINKKLEVLKHFGPGNFCLFIGILLLKI
jgi:phosphatidylglycerophosphate synthase